MTVDDGVCTSAIRLLSTEHVIQHLYTTLKINRRYLLAGHVTYYCFLAMHTDSIVYTRYHICVD